MKRTIALLMVVISICLSMTACSSEASIASRNVSNQADNFGVVRRLSVVNAITDKPLYELIAAFSFELTNDARRIVVTCKVGDDQYKKHSIGLPDVALWVVEDISGAHVSGYRYEYRFNPSEILPIIVDYEGNEISYEHDVGYRRMIEDDKGEDKEE